MENQTVINQSSIPTQIGSGVWLADQEHGFYWGQHKEALDSYHTSLWDLPDQEKNNEMIRYFATLIKYTREELKDYFTVKEALYLVASTNGSGFEFAATTPKCDLYIQIIDSAEYEPYAEDFGADVQSLAEKIATLTEFQTFVVYQMCFEYLHRLNKPDDNYEALKLIFGIRTHQAKS